MVSACILFSLPDRRHIYIIVTNTIFSPGICDKHSSHRTFVIEAIEGELLSHNYQWKLSCVVEDFDSNSN